MAGKPANPSSFFFCVDDVDYEADRPKITAAEMMQIAGVTPEQGLLLVNEDGTQTLVQPDQEFVLTPKPKLRRKPKFRRGAQ